MQLINYDIVPFSMLVMTDAFRRYNPGLSAHFESQFPYMQVEKRAFENLMPLFVAEVAESVPHAVVPFLMNGDNWEEAIATLFSLSVLTQNTDDIGKKVDSLGLLVPFIDQRQDKATRKPFPQNPDTVAVVKSQASMTKAFADMAAKVAGVEYIVQLDGHSKLATEQYKEAGVEVLNITAAHDMIRSLQNGGKINNTLQNVICGVDLGNISLVKAIHDKFGFEVAVIHKKRIPDQTGARSITTHELMHGDVSGKRVIVMDDMIGSFGTMNQTIKLLVRHGAKEIVLCATHPVLSGEYYKKMQEALAYPQVTCILSTNSIPAKRPIFGEKDAPYILVQEAQSQEAHSQEAHSQEDLQRDGRAAPRIDSQSQQSPQLPQLVRKELEIFDLTDFWTTVAQAMLAATGNMERLRKELDQFIHDQLDPYEVYAQMTGKEIEPPKVEGVYLGKGVYRKI